VLGRGCGFEDALEAGFHDSRVHAEEGGVEVDGADDVVAEEERNVGSQETTH